MNPWEPPPFPEEWEKDEFYTKFLGWDPKDEQFMNNLKKLYARDPAQCVFDPADRFETQDGLIQHYETEHIDDILSRKNFDTVMDDPVVAAIFMKQYLGRVRSRLEEEINTRNDLHTAFLEIQERLQALEATKEDTETEIGDIVKELKANHAAALEQCEEYRYTLEAAQENLIHDVESLEKEHEQLLARVESLTEERDGLSEHLGGIYDKGDIPSLKVSDQIAIRDSLSMMFERLNQLGDQSDSSADLLQTIQSLQARVAELDQVKAELTQARKEINDLHDDLDTKEDLLMKANSALEKLKTRNKEVESQNESILSEMENVTSDMESLVNLRAEASKWMEKYHDLEKKAGKWEEKDKRQEQEIERLRTLMLKRDEVDLNITALRSENKKLARMLAACKQGASKATQAMLGDFLDKTAKKTLIPPEGLGSINHSEGVNTPSEN